MQVVRLIERKRDGGALTAGEWTELVAAYRQSHIPDYQMAALLMAVVHRGMTKEELFALTGAMLSSGRALSFGADVAIRVDKHSTGGVGDKVSLLLAPMLAAAGVGVPMMSGRGLGHTGGTLDKLESIPGFRTDLSIEEVQRQVARIGLAMFGQSEEIAPVDRRLYALRDVTGTVPSVPLIAASIMSKKLAEDLTALVLDIKMGDGAFLKDAEQARRLAETMVELGDAHACPTSALLTAMDRPLGRAIGNTLEVEEAILTFHGDAPDDLLEVTLALGAEVLRLAGAAASRSEAVQRLEDVLSDGSAAECLRRLIEAQGGSPAIVDDPAGLPAAKFVRVVEAQRSGVVSRVVPTRLGEAVVMMGGGRRVITDEIDPTVGLVVTARPGERVECGQPIASVYGNDEDACGVGERSVLDAISIDEAPGASSLPLVVGGVNAADL